MSCLTLTLQQKLVSIRAENGNFVSKVSFKAALPKGERLSTADGKDVSSGYIEFIVEKPAHETDCLWFNDRLEDPDSGSIDPPNISFYARVSSDVFAYIRDAHPAAAIQLRLHFDFTGPIQFDNPLGTCRSWDTARQNPVPVNSYELMFSSTEGDA